MYSHGSVGGVGETWPWRGRNRRGIYNALLWPLCLPKMSVKSVAIKSSSCCITFFSLAVGLPTYLLQFNSSLLVLLLSLLWPMTFCPMTVHMYSISFDCTEAIYTYLRWENYETSFPSLVLPGWQPLTMYLPKLLSVLSLCYQIWYCRGNVSGPLRCSKCLILLRLLSIALDALSKTPSPFFSLL